MKTTYHCNSCGEPLTGSRDPHPTRPNEYETVIDPCQACIKAAEEVLEEVIEELKEAAL